MIKVLIVGVLLYNVPRLNCMINQIKQEEK